MDRSRNNLQIKDSIYTYYEAKTSSFSPFAITGMKGEVIPISLAIEAQETTDKSIATPTSVKTKGTPGFEIIMGNDHALRCLSLQEKIKQTFSWINLHELFE